jgi:hypothetical protein
MLDQNLVPSKDLQSINQSMARVIVNRLINGTIFLSDDMNILLHRHSPLLPVSLLFLRRVPFCSVIETTLICRPFSYDHVVIGAGVVGLAVAAKLAE